MLLLACGGMDGRILDILASFPFSLGFGANILGDLSIVLLNCTETLCLNVVLFWLAGNLFQPDSYIAGRNSQVVRLTLAI